MTEWLLGIWLSGCGLFGLRILLGALRLWRLKHRSQPAADGPLLDEFQQQCLELHLRRHVQFLVGSNECVPMAWGVFRRVVLVPSSIQDWPAEQRRSVLLHELGHVARRDCLVQWIVELIRCVYWFQPLIQVAVWRLHVERENACDDLVLNSGVTSRQYARYLLEVVSQCRLPRVACALGVAMSARSRIERRLRTLLDDSRNRRRPGTRQLVGTLVAAALLSLPISMLQATDQADSPGEEPNPVVESANDSKTEETPTDAESADAKAANDNQSDAAPAAKPSPKSANIRLDITTPKTVRVVDEDDKPIAGASVRVGWWEDSKDRMLGVIIVDPPKTDEQGRATIQVPQGAVRAQISAQAEGFAASGTQYSLAGEPTLQLKKGRVVRVRARDETGRLIPDAVPMLSRVRAFPREFKASDNGVHVSPVVDLGRRWLRVIDDGGAPDAPLRFSDLIDVTDPAAADEHGIINAVLHDGVRLEGRLDDSVPRPIKAGIVELCIFDGQQHRIETAGWQWQDSTAVNPDGTFVFDSLPRGAHAQLFALVDGWQSTNPTETELRDYFVQHDAGEDSILDRAFQRPGIWPRLVPLKQNVVDVTLPCQKTTSVDVRVVDPAGNPLEGATVTFNPNGYFLGGELFIPGTEWSLSKMVRAAIQGAGAPLPQPDGFTWKSFIRVQSDSDGIARVRNLPGVGSESYKVEADGFVMPVHPTSTPGETPNSAMRYAVIDRAPGETLRRTITMERDVQKTVHEVLIVDEKGKPVPDVSVTVTEIAMLPDAEQWQAWSVQRFGAIARGKTDKDGQAQLRCPTVIGDRKVVRIRVKLQGSLYIDNDRLRDASIWNEIAMPLKDDGRVIVVTPKGEKPPRPQLQRVSVRLVDAASLFKISKQDLLNALVEEPSLVMLRQLLAQNGFDAAEPLEFKSERNWAGYVGDRDRSPVMPVSGSVVALCSVRPKGAEWKERPRLRSAPEAALVFRRDGTLVRMLGGGYGAQGSTENATLVHLGATGDFFVWVSSFEKHGPFEYVSRVFRVGHEERPSLTIHHYANSTSWATRNGKSDPTAEFGKIGFSFNGQDIAHKLGGMTPDGLMVARNLTWDGRLNQFAGVATQSFDGRPLYRLVTEESAEFKPLDLKAEHVTAIGGRRDFQNWHQWTVTVQKSHPVSANLILTSDDGSEQAVIPATLLKPGQHNLQLQIDPSKQTETQSTLRIRIDGGNKDEIVKTIPRLEIDDRPSVEGQSVAVSKPPPLSLFDKSLANGKSRLKWVLEPQ